MRSGGNQGLVLKPAAVAAFKSLYAKALLTNAPGKTVPCTIIGDPKLEPSAEGRIWVSVPLGLSGTMARIQVDMDQVLVRHPFVRPWVPLTLIAKAEKLAGEIRILSEVARISQETFMEDDHDRGDRGCLGVPGRRYLYPNELRG